MTLGVVVGKVEDLELYEGVGNWHTRVSKSHKNRGRVAGCLSIVPGLSLLCTKLAC